jgi:hypothetical protein
MVVNLLTSEQTFKKVFNSVHIVMPSNNVASLQKNIFKTHPCMHDEVTYGVLDNILESAVEDAEETYNSLLILDDVTATLKNKELITLLKRTIYNRSHYRLSIVILVQSYNAMPLSIRKTISNFISFKPRNKKEFTAIFEELFFLDKEEGEALTRFVFDIPHAFPYMFPNAEVNTNSLYKIFVRITQRDASKDKEKD